MYTPSRKALLAKVHIAKKQLGMDDTTYRAMLEHNFGVESASKLGLKKLVQFCSILEAKGAVFTQKNNTKKQAATIENEKFYPIADADPACDQKRMIAALWCEELGYKAGSLDTRAKKQFGVEKFTWLKKQEDLQKLGKDLYNRVQAKYKKQAREMCEAFNKKWPVGSVVSVYDVFTNGYVETETLTPAYVEESTPLVYLQGYGAADLARIKTKKSADYGRKKKTS